MWTPFFLSIQLPALNGQYFISWQYSCVATKCYHLNILWNFPQLSWGFTGYWWEKAISRTQTRLQAFWWVRVVNDCIPTTVQFFFRLVYKAQEMKFPPRKFCLRYTNMTPLIANNILYSIYFIYTKEVMLKKAIGKSQ